MKKLAALFVLATGLLICQATIEAKVVWDGAEIVKGQIGKLIFNKDVKIYKKNNDQTFTTLIVKKGQSYRVYSISSETVGKVYWMSGDYRVQASNLVTYKAVPEKVKQELLEDIAFNTSLAATRMVSSKSGASLKKSPSLSAYSDTSLPYGTVVVYLGSASNGFSYVRYQIDSQTMEGYILSTFLSALPTKKTEYITYGTMMRKGPSEDSPAVRKLKRQQQVYVYTTQSKMENYSQSWSYVTIGDTLGYVPSSALSVTKPTEPLVVKGGLTPRSPSISYFDGLNYGNLIWDGKNSWIGIVGSSDSGVDFNFEVQITYMENSNHLSVSHGNSSIDLKLPVAEGDPVTFTDSDGKHTEYVFAIRSSYKNFMGYNNYSNVIETSNGFFIAPGYGVIRGWGMFLN